MLCEMSENSSTILHTKRKNNLPVLASRKWIDEKQEWHLDLGVSMGGRYGSGHKWAPLWKFLRSWATWNVPGLQDQCQRLHWKCCTWLASHLESRWLDQEDYCMQDIVFFFLCWSRISPIISSQHVTFIFFRFKSLNFCRQD